MSVSLVVAVLALTALANGLGSNIFSNYFNEPLLRQIHGDGVVEGHKQVHSQRVDKQENQHGPIAGGQPAHDHQPHQYQHLGHNFDIEDALDRAEEDTL